MRGGFVFSGLFWGVFLIVLGLLSIFKTVFNLNIPLFRLGFALFIIYIGVSMLVNGFGITTNRNLALFEEKRFELSDDYQEYNIIFGRGEINLTDPTLAQEQSKIEINTVFASTIIRINPEIPMKVKVDSAFASAKMPDGNRISFGDYTYQTKGLKEGDHYLQVEADVVFGELVIEER